MAYWQKYFKSHRNMVKTINLYEELQSTRKVCEKLFELTGVTISTPSLTVHLKKWGVPMRGRGGANTRSFWGDLMQDHQAHLLKLQADGYDNDMLYREVRQMGQELDPHRKHLCRSSFWKNWRELKKEL